jgi:hypothetical protein
MRKLVSIKKLAANRRNSERSTGPKTGEGKNTVKWNALKHGLLAKAAVLPQEDRAEYERLWAGLVEDYQPVGILEELHVEEIACTYWRRRRAVRAEGAKIELDMTLVDNKAKSTLTETYQDEAARNIPELWGCSAGLQRLSEVFDDMAREIRQDGKLSAESIAWLEADGPWSGDGPWSKNLDALRGATKVTDAAKEEARECLLSFIDEIQKEVRRQIKVREAQEATLRDTVMARQGILEDSAGEAILRYERTMDRKLDMLIARLERLQRRRRSETVAPAIRVDVTKNA